MNTGVLALMGSGELAPSMVSTHRWLRDRVGAQKVLVLDTPFGFQENADQLTDRMLDHVRRSLGAEARAASYRTAGDLAALERQRREVGRARYVFAGPGSPSYALGLWRDAGFGADLAGVVQRGGALVLASAAAITAGDQAVPVYEIYKVGQPATWMEGLAITRRLGLPMVAVPHWDNREGGNHDTSHCYIGARRFAALEATLEVGVLGIDEHTAAVLDFGEGHLRVTGVGSVTVRGGEGETAVPSGDEVGLDEVSTMLGSPATTPAPPAPGTERFDKVLEGGDLDEVLGVVLAEVDLERLRPMVVALTEAAVAGRWRHDRLVAALVELRDEARAQGRFDQADAIRERLRGLGLEVRDTPAGTRWDLR